MVIEYTHKSQQFGTQPEVCKFLDDNRDNIKSIISISPNLHANAYVVYYQEYVKEKPFKMMKKKDWVKIKEKRKQAKLKK